MSTEKQGGTAKKALWSVVLFYLLIAFEIFYMAGPFAIYFYGVYNPILNFFNQSPVLSFLSSFYMPHVAREAALISIKVKDSIGTILTVFGFVSFLVGACQIYYSKFTRKGAVTGGIYNFVRHPQYTSFAVCGFGLLILWPRYINLLMYVTMLFVYYLLAKSEEKECGRKFGQAYIEYKNKTSMFLPFKISFAGKLPSLPKSGAKRALVLTCMYVFTLVIAFGIAKAINVYSINSLYAVYTEDSATVSLCKISSDKLEQIINIAAADEKVQSMINKTGGSKLLNYVLPTEWYAAEIPMNGVKYRAGHLSPSNYDDTRYKIIFTKAKMRGDAEAAGKEMLANILEREPIVEVWVDLTEQTVLQILEIPDNYKYKGIPVAVY